MIFKGGNALLGHNAQYNNYFGAGLPRSGGAGGTGAASDPLFGSYTKNPGFEPRTATLSNNNSLFYTHTRVNGESIDPTVVGLDNDYNLISLSAFMQPIRTSALACIHYNDYTGGQKLGEVILYTRHLAKEEVADIEAYLMNKWFGKIPSGYNQAVFGDLVVENGATFTSVGNNLVPVVVNSVSGGGVIDADIAFSTGTPDFTVTIDADGDVGCITLTGTVDLSNGGTIRVIGDLNNVEHGRYTILESQSIAAGQNWTLEFVGEKHSKTATLKIEDGRLSIGVFPAGTAIIIR